MMAKRSAKQGEPEALLLTAHGTAQLLDADDNVLWSSDDDQDFTDEFDDEFLEEQDVEKILEFLVDAEYIKESEELDLRIDYLEDADDSHGRGSRC